MTFQRHYIHINSLLWGFPLIRVFRRESATRDRTVPRCPIHTKNLLLSYSHCNAIQPGFCNQIIELAVWNLNQEWRVHFPVWLLNFSHMYLISEDPKSWMGRWGITKLALVTIREKERHIQIWHIDTSCMRTVIVVLY